MPDSHIAIRRTTAAALPAAIVGSLALSLAGGPAAHAADAGADRAQAPLAPASPAFTPHGFSGTAAASGLDAALALAMAPAAAQVAAKRTPTTHRVVPGDTIWGIAVKYGLQKDDLLSWNGLSRTSILHTGQKIRLAPPSGEAKAAPSTEDASPHRTTTKPAATTANYTVHSGDTLYEIARGHGLSTQALLSANKLNRSSIIYPGQKLVIPGSAAPATATTAGSAPAASTADTVQPGGSYAVRGGDSMSSIAAKHGVSVAALLKSNGMDWSSIIYPGQEIRIPTTGIPGLTTEQAANARLIVRIGRSLGVSNRGIAIALGTAMQESGLRNLDHGDRDSLGLFQQRPSTGWGSAAQVRDAERSTRAFFGGSSDPNGRHTRGLLDIDGWEKMSFADAAQAVQVSAYPSRYAQWEKPAYSWLAAIQ